MSDHDALLATVLAAPDADLPRLVMADFLQETGEPAQVARAEFIRAQVELAAGVADDVRRVAVTAREKALLAVHGPAWLAPLKAKGEALQNAGTHGQFHRGFVDLVWMPAAVYLKKADKLFARAPVRRLRLTRVKLPDLAELVALPATRKLAELDMSDLFLGDDVARLFADAAGALALDVLGLRGCNVTDAGAELLAAAPPGWAPRVFDLAHNPVGPAGRAVLVRRFPGATFGG